MDTAKRLHEKMVAFGFPEGSFKIKTTESLPRFSFALLREDIGRWAFARQDELITAGFAYTWHQDGSVTSIQEARQYVG